MEQVQQGKLIYEKSPSGGLGSASSTLKTTPGSTLELELVISVFHSSFLCLYLSLLCLSLFSFTQPPLSKVHPSVFILKNEELTYINFHVKGVIHE